jgi:hypothetical protein
MTEANGDIARKNMLIGWGLLALFVVLFIATVAAALIYLAVD